jgi:HAD superfamily hydrolase (TIGR01450 family)
VVDDVHFVLCDLDGVVWLARTAIPGSAEAIGRVRASGRRVLFVTNNSMSTIADQEAALGAIGIPARGDVVTSAQAAASLVGAGERVLVCGGDGLVEAIDDRGATPVRSDGSDRSGSFDAVVIGLHHHFDYWGLHAASAAIRGGARFIATNDDPTFPTPDGPIPGAGALVAAVRAASATEPVWAGKPHHPMADLVAARCGPEFRPERALVVGDRGSTDGLFAAAVGCPFALVRSGVTAPGAVPDVSSPALIDVADLAAVADAIIGGRH